MTTARAGLLTMRAWHQTRTTGSTRDAWGQPAQETLAVPMAIPCRATVRMRRLLTTDGQVQRVQELVVLTTRETVWAIGDLVTQNTDRRQQVLHQGPYRVVAAPPRSAHREYLLEAIG